MARRLGPLIALLAACAPAPKEDAARLYEAGEYERALLAYGEAIGRNPQDALARYRRACCRLRLIERDGPREEDIRAALEDLDRAIEASPDDYPAYYARAMAYAVMARYKEAAQDLLVCVQSQDKNLKRKAHVRLGEIYDEKFEEMQVPALRHYQAAAQLGDTSVAARLKELDQAERETAADVESAQLKDLDRAKRASSPQEAADLLAAILHEPRLGREPLQEARDLYVRVRLEVETERRADALLETAVGLAKSGKREGAKDLFEEIIRKYPETPAARKAAAALLELLK
jgi:tetratricopeptide (TPR) repeat protein